MIPTSMMTFEGGRRHEETATANRQEQRRSEQKRYQFGVLFRGRVVIALLLHEFDFLMNFCSVRNLQSCMRRASIGYDRRRCGAPA